MQADTCATVLAPLFAQLTPVQVSIQDYGSGPELMVVLTTGGNDLLARIWAGLERRFPFWRRNVREVVLSLPGPDSRCLEVVSSALVPGRVTRSEPPDLKVVLAFDLNQEVVQEVFPFVFQVELRFRDGSTIESRRVGTAGLSPGHQGGC